MEKIIHVLKYNHSNNIWDVIQSLISKNILEKLWYKVKYINQLDLHKESKEKINLFINWFFCFDDNDFWRTFPFAKNINPIFSNIHLELDYWKKNNLEKQFFNEKNKEYLKKYEPIWCRDQATCDVFNKNWIKAINNDCMTLLFNKRTIEEEKNAKKLILVDVDEFVPIPKKFKNNYEHVTQNIHNWTIYSNDTKLNISENILEYYKKNAALIITSRFHCAMPCTAMWIPVIFLWDKNYRLEQRFVKIYPYIHFWFRHRTLFKKWKYSKYIPLLNLNVRFWFNIIDIFYSISYKIILNLAYKFNIIKIDWDIKAPDIEKLKEKRFNYINEILKWI